MLTESHASILESRGFDIELLARLGVSSDNKLGDYCIAIPYYHGDDICNIKYRTISGEKRFMQEAGREPRFYNEAAISDSSLQDTPLIICEGELDAWAAMQAGFARAISVPNGAPMRETDPDAEGSRYQFIDHAPTEIWDGEIIIATDSDNPGIALMNDLALRLERKRCRWVRYPRDCKDLADALKRYGVRGVRAAIERAQWMQLDGLYRMDDLPPLPEIKALDSGFPGLSNHYKLRPGDLAVVTGVPSHGKTTVVNDIACRMANKHNWAVAFASFEQRPQRDHRRYLRTWYNAKLVVHQTPEEIDRADAWIREYFHFVVPAENDNPTLEWVLDKLSGSVIRYGVKMCIIDPWNEVEHDMQRRPAAEYTSTALRELRRFARKYQIHLVVVAHPAKMKRLENGKYPPPTLYDIADSAAWYNRPDVGIIVYRKSTDIDTTIRVQKVRFQDEIGFPGDVKVRFVRERATFEAIPE
jgi:twinkle protein